MKLKKILKRTSVAILLVLFVLSVTLVIVYWNELRSLNSIEKLEDHPFYRMTYYGDYGFDEFLETGATSDKELEQFVTRRLTHGLPLDLGVADGGCTVFMVRNEHGEVMFCRNYDFPYTPVMQLFTSPDTGFRSVSTIELDFLGYSKEYEPSGINKDSVYALATPFMPWDGMNEKGVAIALLAVPEAHGPNDDGKVTLGTTTMIRLVLDKASTVKEAVELMKQYNIYFSAGVCCHYLIADASGDSVLVEFWDGELQTITTQENFQVASNFIAYNDLNIGEGFNEFERYETAMNRIAENGNMLTEQQAIALLAEVGIRYNGEDKLQWSVVYNLTNRTGKIFLHRDTDNIFCFELT